MVDNGSSAIDKVVWIYAAIFLLENGLQIFTAEILNMSLALSGQTRRRGLQGKILY